MSDKPRHTHTEVNCLGHAPVGLHSGSRSNLRNTSRRIAARPIGARQLCLTPLLRQTAPCGGSVDIWLSIATGIVTNMLTFVIPMAAAILIARIEWKQSTRRFFGMRSGGRHELTMLLSNIYVRSRGTIGASESNPIERGFCGFAITEAEYHFALRLARSIETKGISRIFRSLAARARSDIPEPVTCRLRSSPPYVREESNKPTVRFPHDEIEALLRESRSLVVVGSTVYNAVAEVIMAKSEFEFVQKQLPEEKLRGVLVRRYHSLASEECFWRTRIETIPGAGVAVGWRDYAFIERFSPRGPDCATVLWCAGTSTTATAVALDEASKWRALNREFPDQHFALLFEVHAQATEFSASADLDAQLALIDRRRIWSTSRSVT